MVQETYSLLELDDDADEDRGPNTIYAPPENMFSAARVIASLLDSQSIQSVQSDSRSIVYGILGGFSMQLRGGRISTRDMELVTSVNMKGVWDAITGDERIVIPKSRLVEGIIKVFIKTGEPFDHCKESHRIEVDVTQPGFLGSPRDLDANVEVLGPFEIFGQPFHFNVFNIASMIRIKVDCCLSREEQRDFADVRYMIQSHGDKVRSAIADGVVDEKDLLEALDNAKMGDAGLVKSLKELVGLKS